MTSSVQNSIKDGITQIDVARGHVDLGPQTPSAVNLKFLSFAGKL
jgi:hypothetical protein